MKKIFLLLTGILLMACNSDDSNQLTDCENKIWSLVQNGSGGSTSATYIATYGPTLATAGSVITNESTYNYYTSRGNVTDGSQCWEGTK